MFKPDHFQLYEVFPGWFYNANSVRYGDGLWRVFDERLLWTMDNLRKRYGTLVANDWKWGGHNHNRGWRATDCPIGAYLSQHKLGNASDMKPVHTTAEQIRQDILNDPFCPDFKHITCIEMGVSWLHVSVENHNKKHLGIKLVYPK